ncbi:uncharacterized protein BCR38DRAFT_441297 [Pseudomassariella vexata]|uniref:Uncharacterized protein n=1 Tax=Pseudomassariella vexata TaxID=1141098 RepID=A0A1Y2DMN1_9PEZI|nr:uncharacterized protein BCR38DRAFT_441297 [Pseudomassariella vexata]ORY60500.1 hypothetical protein BCR38DRAFT_441297 [Pseudomassariella vexata]
MAAKRPAEDDSVQQKPKRHRFNARGSRLTDPTYGQRGAFGNLDHATVPSDDDLNWEDDTDALAYLKTVRQEASAIPHVLVASKAGPQLPAKVENDDGEYVDRSIYKDGRGDFRGYYQDGAYISRPDDYHGEQDDDEEGEEGEYEVEIEENGDDDYELDSADSSYVGPINSSSAEIHEAYYTALINQYQSMRQLLHTAPPESAIAALPTTNPTEVPKFGPTSQTFPVWTGHVRNNEPLPAQIAVMHKDSVIRLIRVILGAKFFRKGHEVRERTSRWLWALLARLPDKGELDYQEIGWVRELGKRAVLLMLSMAEAEALHQDYDIGLQAGSEHEAEVEVDEAIDEELSPYATKDDNTGYGLDDVPRRSDDMFPSSDNHQAGREQETRDVSAKEADAYRHEVSNDEPAKAKHDLCGLEPNVRNDADAGADKGKAFDLKSRQPEAEDMHDTVEQHGAAQKGHKPYADTTHSSNAGVTENTDCQNADTARQPTNNGASSQSDVDMQDDTDIEDGEVSDNAQPEEHSCADIEAVKARLLAQLDGMSYSEEATVLPIAGPDDTFDKRSVSVDDEASRAKTNMRATINMVLTVAGEFYGQRDLLEFRNPFGSMVE